MIKPQPDLRLGDTFLQSKVSGVPSRTVLCISTPRPQTSLHHWNLMNLILSVWRRMFSYMYEFNFPKYDYNANSIEVQRSNVREKSARERSKLRRSKSSHSLDCKVRPKSHRFRREKDFDPCYYYNQNNELKLIDLEEENASTNFSAWCVSFDSEKVKFTVQPVTLWIIGREIKLS